MRERLLRAVNFSRVDMLRLGVFAAMGFFLSGAQISGIFSPFGIAFCMAVPYEMLLPSFAGSVLGYFLFSGGSATLYAAALLLGVSVKFVFSSRDEHVAFDAVISFGALAAVYLFSMLFYPTGVGTWMLHLAEILLCTSMTFLYSLSLRTEGKPQLTAVETACLAIMGATLLLSLLNLSLFGFNLGRLAAAVCIVGAAMASGASGGAACGLLCTIAFALYTKDFAVCGGIYAASGFVAGAFRPFKKGMQSVLFVGMALLCGAFIGGLQFQMLLEATVGSVIALFLPWETFAARGRSDMLTTGAKTDRSMATDISLRLRFTAGALMELQNSVEECAKRLDGGRGRDLFGIYQKTADEVCRHCGLNTFCWVTAYNDVMKALHDISDLLRRNGRLETDRLPPFFRQKCCKIDEFISSVNNGYRDYLSKEQAARRVGEARQIAAEQFSGISQMLLEMSEEISDVVHFDEEAAVVIRNLMRDRGIECDNISCLVDRFERMTIDLYFQQEPDLRELEDLTGLISDRLEREFELPNYVAAERRYRLSYYETAALQVDFAAAQLPKMGNRYCGDSYDFFMDSKGFAHLLLSDGMGTGSRAAVDSTMTCSTIRRLLQTGFGFGAAFKLMNLSFAVKSREESLATVDACTIDLYTGMTRFVKAGAASSFVKIGNRVTEFTSSSLPIGIIQGVPYDSDQTRLGKGDIIVLVSDGVSISGGDWLAEELKLICKKTAKEIANALCQSARKRELPEHSDDITVLVAKLQGAK